MLKWAKKAGKILAESVINCLRELAVSALKSEMGARWHVAKPKKAKQKIKKSKKK